MSASYTLPYTVIHSITDADGKKTSNLIPAGKVIPAKFQFSKKGIKDRIKVDGDPKPDTRPQLTRGREATTAETASDTSQDASTADNASNVADTSAGSTTGTSSETDEQSSSDGSVAAPVASKDDTKSKAKGPQTKKAKKAA